MIIKGKKRLAGEVEIESSKNAILPIIAASLLTDDEVKIRKVPYIKDVTTIIQIIRALGKQVKEQERQIIITGKLKDHHPPYELVRQMRASILLMGSILSREEKVRISLPGGCAIGNRPIDLHLKGFHGLGANINFDNGDVIAKAKRLKGNHIYLDYPSVGATENLIMAAALAQGNSYIENAALEPEIQDLANFVNSMGGKVTGAGTNVIQIEGVRELHGSDYTPIPDRIEAGTYMLAVAATGGQAVIKNIIPEHLKAVSGKLEETGVEINEYENHLTVKRDSFIKPVNIKTLPYPGFPTDMQAQFMSFLSCARGSSIISESVFDNRYMHVQELQRMGAEIKIEGRAAIIKGVKELTGAQVKASDLRAGAALIIAGLTAEGSTLLTGIEHVERGYEGIITKLNALGANISQN